MLRSSPMRCARPFAQQSSVQQSRQFASITQCSRNSQSIRQSAVAFRAQKKSPCTTLTKQPLRLYANNAPEAILSPAPKPKKRWGFFRTAWRITWISSLLATGYFVYTIIDINSPAEQVDPDPSKKTLVVLGKIVPTISMDLLTTCRNWLGCRLIAQETRHRKLQCHRGFTKKLLPLHTTPTLLYNRLYRTQIHHGTDTKCSPSQESRSPVL